MMQAMPPELVLRVFGQLSVLDCVAVAQTCSAWKRVLYQRLYTSVYLAVLLLNERQELHLGCLGNVTVISGMSALLRFVNSLDNFREFIKIIHIDYVIYDEHVSTEGFQIWKGKGLKYTQDEYTLVSDRHYGFYMLPRGDVTALFENHLHMRFNSSMTLTKLNYSILTVDYIRYFTRRLAEVRCTTHVTINQQVLLEELLELMTLPQLNLATMTIYNNSSLLNACLLKSIQTLQLEVFNP